MRTRSASLLAHQKQPARVPALTLSLSTRRIGVESLRWDRWDRWDRWYAGAEADAPTAAAMARPKSVPALPPQHDGGNSVRAGCPQTAGDAGRKRQPSGGTTFRKRQEC